VDSYYTNIAYRTETW